LDFMEREDERYLGPETGPAKLKLGWSDLRAGHWPGSKDPL